MIKKLRRRFIIVNMCILTCVLIGVLSGIYTYMYSSEARISYELMESILNQKDIIKEPDDREPDKMIPFDDENTLNIYYPADDSGTIIPLAFEYGNPDNFNNDNRDNRNDPFQNNFPPNPDHRFPDKQDPDNREPGNREPDQFKPDEPPVRPVTEPAQNATQPAVQKPTENKTTIKDAADKPTSGLSSDKSEQTSTAAQNESSKPEQSGTVTQSKQDNTSPVTTAPVSKDAADTQKNSTQVTSASTSPTPELPLQDGGAPPFEKEFPDPYRGNVKRAYVMVMINNKNDIDRFVYQYFEETDISRDEVKAAVETVVNKSDNKGIIQIGDNKLRFMKKENPKMMNGGMKLLFLDRTLEISTINRLLFILIIICCVGFIVIFGISVLLANWMIKPVDRAWKQQKQFVADASHELKTPLTVISSNTDVILSSPDESVKSQSKWLDYIKEETKRMTKLVNSMLYIAKYDSNEIKFTNSKFDLSNTLSSICLQYEPLLFEKEKTLETNIKDNIMINGDEDKIKQLVNILLDNAGKYSTEKGIIRAMLSRNEKTGKARLAVSNTSEYIAPEKLDKLFDRFYRLDDSRNRKTGGSGLGLNIAKSIVEAHGGSISAYHENGITTFAVDLP